MWVWGCGGGLGLCSGWSMVIVCGLLRVSSGDVGVGVARLVLLAVAEGFVGAFLCLFLILSGRRVRLVMYWMREVTYEFNSQVMTYPGCDRERVSACYWVWWRVGMRPWYMVPRLIRNMCRPHVHPYVC
jgi:hypothetical protein